MKNNIKLFIGDKEVDFSTTPDILYNYTLEDLTNPTVINNGYSKTLTIEGTPKNNKIFGHFWNLDRIQRYGESAVGTEFNPSRKTPFSLYVNGTLYESGYIKLDEVVRTGRKVQYNVTLYGGLGEVFYLLSYDDNGNQLKLSDLTYMSDGGEPGSGTENEFDFTINKETIRKAWFDVGPGSSTYWKWHYINFAPCYNGIPSSNFSADKAIVNFSGSPLDHSMLVSALRYQDKNGYSLATLPEKVDEWAMRDLRSYMQRPVLRVDGLFEACERWLSQYGYSFDLDDTFFESDNPYWTDAWFTLPMLNEISINGTSENAAITATTTADYAIKYNGWENTRYRLAFTPNFPVGTTKVNAKVNIRYFSNRPGDVQPISGLPLYTSAIIDSYKGDKRSCGAICLQLVCYDGTNINTANVIGGSNIKILTSKIGDDYIKWNEILRFWTPKWSNAEYSYSFGTLNPVGNYKYDWSELVDFSMEIPSNTQAIGMDITTTVNPINDAVQDRRGRFYISTHIPYPNNYTGTSLDVTAARLMTDIREAPLTGSTFSAYTAGQTAGYTGAQLTKQLLLSTEHTPAEYLLSYCKQFGLMFVKKPEDKVIHIMQRGTFYNDDEHPVDLDNLIDHSADMNITPLAFDSNWYDMSLEMVEGDFSKRYQNTYGRVYGSEKINTGYEFNADEKQLMEGNVFRSAVEGLGKSKYYLAPVTYSSAANVPYVTFQGMKYLLYHQGTTLTDDKTYTVELSNLTDVVSSISLGNEKYEDAYPKVQFCDSEGKGTNGEGVLLFYNYLVELKNGNGALMPYFITDDIPQMGLLNNNTPCWLYTSIENGTGYTSTSDTKNMLAIKTNYLPRFDRYQEAFGYIQHSWDFGEPRELFIPNIATLPSSAIYNRFWQPYINDLYDVNTRILSCSVVKENFKPSPELFRKLYKFENCYWRLNSITDWNIATYDTGLAEFVKVNDVDAYRSKEFDVDPDISVTPNAYTANTRGETFTVTVNVSDMGPWYVEDNSQGWITVTPSAGSSPMDVTVEVPENQEYETKQWEVTFMVGNRSDTLTITQYGIDE